MTAPVLAEISMEFGITIAELHELARTMGLARVGASYRPGALMLLRRELEARRREARHKEKRERGR